MTKIDIYKTGDGIYKGFRCLGHAGSGAYGNDIVCASISILVINTINALEEYCDTKLQVEADEETGMISCMLCGTPNDKTKLLLDTMILGLTSVESQYGKKYCKVRFEEV